MELEINHFSHEEHPLKLIENWETVAASVFTDDDDDEKKKKDVAECDGCGDPISISGSGSVYGCVPCKYFMHKACAELKSSINHRFHPLHSLTLTILNTNENGWTCDVCSKRYLKERSFSYRCPQCDFDACTKCGVVDALKEELSIKLKHEGHPQHTLTLQSRSASFDCDACLTNKKDLFYKCDDCDFWIHNSCTSLAPTIKLPHHRHPLHIIYSLPDNFYTWVFYCEFCEKRILKDNMWYYHCANCRWFAHINCALNAEPPSTSSDVPVDEDQGKGLLQFPMPYAFTDPLKLLHSENIRQDNDDEIEINHWCHDHPLILIDDAHSQGNIIINFSGDSDVIEVCSVCVRPLSSPYYTCKLDGCWFSLHKYCAHLPLTLEKHHLHPHHLLHLQHNDWYRCNGCYSRGNTFAYQCKICNFYLDVNCAFLPKNIKHKSHNHSLTQVNKDYKLVCKACNRRCNVQTCYSCEACKFYLCLFCATRCPTSIGHRYCKGHDVVLTYPPVEDHPEDFYCEICEEEMHPKKYPLYYCHKCKNSFHLKCLDPFDIYLNLWIQDTLTWSYHKHPLTFVRRKKTPDYVCSKCNVDINGRLILECRSKACNFNICFKCHSIYI